MINLFEAFTLNENEKRWYNAGYSNGWWDGFLLGGFFCVCTAGAWIGYWAMQHLTWS